MNQLSYFTLKYCYIIKILSQIFKIVQLNDVNDNLNETEPFNDQRLQGQPYV